MNAPQLEQLLVGALLEARDPRRVLAAVNLKPGDFVDPFLRCAWSIGLELAARGERPTSESVFLEGRLRNLFADKDMASLRGLEAGNPLDDAGITQVGKQLRRYAHGRKLGEELKALGTLIHAGRDKDGNAFSPNDALPRFDAIRSDYNSLHAEGRLGSDAVLSAMAGFEARRKAGKALLTKSGMPALDELIGGYPHKLVWVLGAPGKGKSAFLGTQIDLHAKMGMTTAIASLEDNDEWLVSRHMALATGMKQREVFSDPFPDEEKAVTALQRLHDSWGKLHIVTKLHVKTAADVIRVFTQYVVQHGATCFYLDNLTALKHTLESKNDEMRTAAGRSIAQLAEFADVFKVPLICLAHTNRAYMERTQGRSPPEIHDTAETADADRYVRLGLSIWQKGPELRVTVNKNTAQGSTVGKTVAFTAHVDQGLIDVDSGAEVNLQEEKRHEQEERAARTQTRKDDEARRTRERNEKWKRERTEALAKAKAEAEAKQTGQGILLDVAQPKERQ